MLNFNRIRKELKDMNEIKNLEPVYLKQYDIHVNRYLTYAQIQQIVNAIIKFDTWTEREQTKDMLILYHATDIGIEKLEEISIDTMLCSRLIDDVKNCIENLLSIDDAIKYTESIQRSLSQIVNKLPEYSKQIEDVIKNGGKNKK